MKSELTSGNIPVCTMYWVSVCQFWPKGFDLVPWVCKQGRLGQV